MTVLLFCGLYFGLRLGFGFFTPYNSLTARQDIKDGEIRIIAVGLPYMPQVRQKLAIQYGFQYDYVGCNVTTELLNGAKYYNKVVETHLMKEYGGEFWINFNRQIDSINNARSAEMRIDKILDIVAGQERVKDKIQLVDSLSKGQRHISLVPVLADTAKGIYVVKVVEDNGLNLVTYYNFMVDANSMKILNEDGKFEKQ